MKHIVSSITAWTLGMLPTLAVAQSKCYLNDEEVPCPDISGAVGAGLVIIPLILFLVGLVSFIFWIMMLVHAARHDIKDKALWIIIIIFTGILGAIIYYFVIKRSFVSVAPAPAATASVPPPATPPSTPAA